VGDGASRNRLQHVLTEALRHSFGDDVGQVISGALVCSDNCVRSIGAVKILALTNYQHTRYGFDMVPCLEWLECAAGAPPSVATLYLTEQVHILRQFAKCANQGAFEQLLNQGAVPDATTEWVCANRDCTSEPIAGNIMMCPECHTAKTENSLLCWMKPSVFPLSGARRLFSVLWSTVKKPTALMKADLLSKLSSAYEAVFEELTPIELFSLNNGWALAAGADYTIEQFFENVGGFGCRAGEPVMCARSALEEGQVCEQQCMHSLLALVIHDAMEEHGMRITDLVYFITASRRLPLPSNLVEGNARPKIQVRFDTSSEYSRLPTSRTCFAQLNLPWTLLGQLGLDSMAASEQLPPELFRGMLAQKLAHAVNNAGRHMGFG
jgi:hypothetical protein